MAWLVSIKAQWQSNAEGVAPSINHAQDEQPLLVPRDTFKKNGVSVFSGICMLSPKTLYHTPSLLSHSPGPQCIVGSWESKNWNQKSEPDSWKRASTNRKFCESMGARGLSARLPVYHVLCLFSHVLCLLQRGCELTLKTVYKMARWSWRGNGTKDINWSQAAGSKTVDKKPHQSQRESKAMPRPKADRDFRADPGLLHLIP